jgi:ATP-dependent DNA helicase RecG
MREPMNFTNIERVRASILQGESHFREFKTAFSGPPGAKQPRDASAIRKDIAEALVAFANADGGEVFIGIEDDGEITGVPHSETVVQSLFNADTSNVMPNTPLAAWKARVDVDGKLIMMFGVEKSLRFIHQTSDGKCLQRRDRETSLYRPLTYILRGQNWHHASMTELTLTVPRFRTWTPV